MSRFCRHQLADLSEGTVDADGCLVCPWHQSRYDVTDGRMVSGPRGLPRLPRPHPGLHLARPRLRQGPAAAGPARPRGGRRGRGRLRPGRARTDPDGTRTPPGPVTAPAAPRACLGSPVVAVLRPVSLRARRPVGLRGRRAVELLRRELGSPLRIIPIGFAAAIAVATLVLMTPWAVTEGRAVGPVPRRGLHRHVGDLRDRSRRGRHPRLLVGLRRDGDPRLRPARRARRGHPGHAARPGRGPAARAAVTAARRGGHRVGRAGRRPGGGARHPGHHARRRDRRRPAAGRPLRGGLRRAAAPGAVARRLPLGVGVQQRRLLAVQRQPRSGSTTTSG